VKSAVLGILAALVLLLAAPLRAVAWAPACAADDALAEAAGALLLEGAPVDSASLARAARAAGSDAPVVHALVARLDEEARVTAWLAALSARSDAPVVCGHARDATRILLLATARGGAFVVPAGLDAAALEVRLDPAFSAPRLVVLDAGGTLHDVVIEPGARRAELPVDAPRPLLVQLVATGPAGPRPVAELWIGRAGAPQAPAPAPLPPASLDERLRAARRDAGVPPVRGHRLLARAAAEQAAAVCASGRVSHLLVGGASPDARFAALGIRARFVGEAIGRATDADAAWVALLGSPSHRAALLDARFTDAGIGTAVDARGRTCVSVALAAWPRFVPGAGVAHASR
jgi:hypothetical protein